ncbi:UDP-4-amino-4,6-dideoxy-N-acetyl-beta-L-altrosamine N-acetyltransferase [Ornithinibacillus salinisoli]|uniref:UDP-4-amino-4, 6-dideoxy-N-acetyl-beta-L-altrosamine N-acetyltransferase n=1 Tax=Ornithinibacillus salinisoli TaxID=1848459 RepID=A0ABW4W6H8_9BACI
MVNIEDFQLKPISYDELNIILQWRNSKRVRSLMYTDHQIDWEEHYQWFNKINKDPKKMVFVLYDKNKSLGIVSFSNINKDHSRCEWGFYIGDETAPKGSGTIMGILALDKIFNEVGLNKVCSQVFQDNTKSLGYHQKLGFEIEGKLIDHVQKNNRFIDVIQMALFAKKWVDVRPVLLHQLGGG